MKTIPTFDAKVTARTRTSGSRIVSSLILAASLAAFGTINGCAIVSGQQTASEYADDSTITAEIKSKLAVDRAIDGSAIGVETLDGVVQLSGFIPSDDQKQKAGTIARGTKGAKTVKNDLVVKR